jgi:DNA-binding MarR family transcriptional regulator
MTAQKILDNIPIAIRTLRRLSASSLDKEVTFQQLRILILTHEGMGPTQIASTMLISTAAVSKMVDTLVRKKFLLREAGEDRRCLKLILTAKGNRIRKTVRRHVENELEINLKKLSKSEQAELESGLTVLSKLMELLNEK